MDSAPEDKKSYWSITPANVRYCEKIVDGAKLLYGEISALCNDKGYCWASNEYFAKLYKNEKGTISRWISALVKENFIYLDMSSGRRKIFLAQAYVPGDVGGPAEAGKPEAEEKPKKEKKKIEKKYTDGDLALAEMLLAKIIYNVPMFENKKINISEWAEDIRKLREIDKATPEQINFMINWVQGGEISVPGKPVRKFEPHEFWAKNIMSAGKLRKQWFNNLVPQLQESVKKLTKKTAQL